MDKLGDTMIQITNIRWRKEELGVAVQKIIARELKKYMEKRFKKTDTTGDFSVIDNGEVVEVIE